MAGKQELPVTQPFEQWVPIPEIFATASRSASRRKPETVLQKRARIFGTTTRRPITALFRLTILSCSLVVFSSMAIRVPSQPRGVLRTRAEINWRTQSQPNFSFGKPLSASVMRTLIRLVQAAKTLFWIRSVPTTPSMTRL